jgi:hypothetical protein
MTPPDDGRGQRKTGGIFLLLLSNMAFAVTMLALQNSFESAGTRLLLLSLGNLLASSILFSPRLTGRPIFPSRTHGFPWFLLWAGAYCLNNGLFVAFPAAVPLVYIGCSQALAPVVAAYLFEGRKIHALYEPVLDALVVAIITAFLFMRSSENATGTANANLIMLVLTLGYVMGQFAARRLAALLPAMSIPPRLSVLNGLFLLPIALVSRPDLGADSTPLVAGVLMLGAAILLIQGTMLARFQRMRPALSGVIVATNVPLFFLVEDVWLGKLPSIAGATLVAAMVCVIGIRAAIRETGEGPRRSPREAWFLVRRSLLRKPRAPRDGFGDL